MLVLSGVSISASITGFENPTLPFLEKTICLNSLLSTSPSSTRIAFAPNNLLSRGIASGDWLIVNSALTPAYGDVLYAMSYGTVGIITYEYLQSSVTEVSDVNVVGVVQQSVHFYRGSPEIPDHDTLKDLNLHSLMVSKEYSTVLAKASGNSMVPHVWDGDLMLIERHLDRKDGDVCVLALNGELVLKRIDLLKGVLSSDNPKFAPHVVCSSDRISHEGVVNKVIRLHRLPCTA
ncbi:S24 family peptidase [Vibrio vulnificus]|nr:S24 family peptidase [Vibrio vulnificus]